jgi:hypothetical protein
VCSDEPRAAAAAPAPPSPRPRRSTERGVRAQGVAGSARAAVGDLAGRCCSLEPRRRRRCSWVDISGDGRHAMRVLPEERTRKGAALAKEEKGASTTKVDGNLCDPARVERSESGSKSKAPLRSLSSAAPPHWLVRSLACPSCSFSNHQA